jgi:hypothetical protein
LRQQQMVCEQEQRDRMQSPRFNQMLNAHPVAVETDPDLDREAKTEAVAKAEREAPKKGPRAKPFPITKERIVPTSKPTTD